MCMSGQGETRKEGNQESKEEADGQFIVEEEVQEGDGVVGSGLRVFFLVKSPLCLRASSSIFCFGISFHVLEW